MNKCSQISICCSTQRTNSQPLRSSGRKEAWQWNVGWVKLAAINNTAIGLMVLLFVYMVTQPIHWELNFKYPLKETIFHKNKSTLTNLWKLYVCLCSGYLKRSEGTYLLWISKKPQKMQVLLENFWQMHVLVYINHKPQIFFGIEPPLLEEYLVWTVIRNSHWEVFRKTAVS